jgi:heat shock protein HtpX
LLLFPAALLVLTFLCSWAAVSFLAETGPRTAVYTIAAGFTLRVYPIIILVTGIWVGVSYFGGDRMLLGFAAASPLERGAHPEVYRQIENVAIMAGLPMPRVYLIEDESLNAFATGRNPEHASVALTSGIVKRLEKLELEGVIAHEMSHIGNRDTTMMMVILVGIGLFTLIGETLLHSALRHSMLGHSVSGSRSKKGKGQGLMLLIAIFCLVFGYLIAPLIRLALSRRMEFQADAAAAKITRHPQALADALRKISADPTVEILDDRPLTGALCIENPATRNSFAQWLSRLYASHPPVADRIRALEEMTRGYSESN